ncbi:MAG TPA: saccharopine dehydrogenase NADP-binding domain-containing protein [Pyrinomonadaceae bacterium]|nr:saccharopine dehydrogenase NADP-binding domain-containing protein [Pyrinomonadaceae bacterium]
MKLSQSFSRRLKTSRSLVFENIMDLDHVCVLHRRWFENLRIGTWRPDYVDYRLTSNFYGLKQEVRVRGAPIDHDRYWYEFNGPLARIRVDGQMEGPDGDLSLTETITLNFAWPLAPLFWLFEPLFKAQKTDILRDDSSLLERAYELERDGFRRSPSAGLLPKVVVYGGCGFFGRCVIQDLLKHSNAQIIVASRNPNANHFAGFGNRVHCYISDAINRESVLELLDDAKVLINCTGPYQGMRLSLLEACIQKRVHYIDVADDRDFVERAYKLRPQIEAAGITALIGCSVVPGLSALLTRRCVEELDGLERVRIFITPGTRFTRGVGSFDCLLATVGEPFSVPRQNRKETIVGWTEAERVEFPPAIGTRTAYSVVDIADYFTQVQLFGAGTVVFKIGSEFNWLNKSLAAIRAIKMCLGLTKLRTFMPVFRAFLRLASLIGTSQGAMMVEVTNGRGNKQRKMKLAVYKKTDGHVIPALLPAIATKSLLDGELSGVGIPNLAEWISTDRLFRELANRGCQ